MSEVREKGVDEVFCSSCGEIIKKEAEICVKCGVRQRGAPKKEASFEGTSDRDWLTTLLLCLFLSGFGVHRFYVGKIGTGILMILFGWLSLGIWHLVDFIMICCGKFKDKEGLFIVSKD